MPRTLKAIIEDSFHLFNNARLNAVLELKEYNFTNSSESDINNAIDAISQLSKDPNINVATIAIYCIQNWKRNGYIKTSNLDKKCISILVNSVTNDMFNSKNGKYMNAVSLTLREFHDTSVLPDLVNKMQPITNAFGVVRVRRCWAATYKALISLLPEDANKKKIIDKASIICGMNIFKNQLGESHDPIKCNSLNRFYKTYFKDVKEIIDRSDDTSYQRRGIDKTIVLKSSKEIEIEEKMRSAKYWEYREKDIILEIISVDKTNVPGWIYTSESDFLVYYFEEPSGKQLALYVFPFNAWLKPWWKQNKKKYESYPETVAPNPAYNTISKIIPISDITEALKKDNLGQYTKLHYIKLQK